MLFTSTVSAPVYAMDAVKLQKQADELREEGKSLKAIKVYNQVIVCYQEDKDYDHMLGALTGRLLS